MHQMKTVFTVLIFILCSVNPQGELLAQSGSPTATLSVSSGAPVNPSGTVTRSVLLSPTGDGANAFSFGLAHSPSSLSVTAVAGSFFDTLTGSQSPLFLTIDLATNGSNQAGFTMAVVLDQNEIIEVPVGTHEVTLASYTASTNAVHGSSPLTFVDSLRPNSPTANPTPPPVRTEVISGGTTLSVGSGLTTVSGAIEIGVIPFIRGDANMSGTITLIDVIYLLRFITGSTLFFPSNCLEVYDIDGNGSFATLGDPFYLLDYMFTGGSLPPAPFPLCGTPSQYRHSCSSFNLCP